MIRLILCLTHVHKDLSIYPTQIDRHASKWASRDGLHKTSMHSKFSNITWKGGGIRIEREERVGGALGCGGKKQRVGRVCEEMERKGVAMDLKVHRMVLLLHPVTFHSLS